jgi:hypothetical protein
MMRRAVEFFSQIDEPDWIAVLQLTDPYRSEYFDTVIQQHVGILNGDTVMDDRAYAAKNLDLEQVNFRARTPIQYRALFNNHNHVCAELFERIIAVSGFLCKRHIQHVFVGMNYRSIPRVMMESADSVYAQQLYKLLPHQQFLDLPCSALLNNSEDQVSSIDKHPSAIGHKKIHNYIKSQLIERNYL